MVEDTAVFGPGNGAKLDATIFDLERLDLLASMRAEAELQVNAGERRRKLPEVGRRGSDQAGELAEAQWVGAIGASEPGNISARRSASSRLASTRIAALSTVRVWLRSVRPCTAA